MSDQYLCRCPTDSCDPICYGEAYRGEIERLRAALKGMIEWWELPNFLLVPDDYREQRLDAARRALEEKE